MASKSTKAAARKSILKSVKILEGHAKDVSSISYFPDGQRMISGSRDRTTRQWDLKAGREIEEARDVCEEDVLVVVVSRDGRWVVTAGGDYGRPELKACEVEAGIVKRFQGDSRRITCISISADSKLLASGSQDFSTRIWNLDAGKLVAGPFETVEREIPAAVRFSTDSKKLAVKSATGRYIEVWNVETQTLDVKIVGKDPGQARARAIFKYAPVFWTDKNKTIITAFNFALDDADTTIYEFDALTLKTVGTPFEGHTAFVTGLALSSDGVLLASASSDTIKLWAFESRQLLASFDVQSPCCLVLSPESRQLAYATSTKDDYKIYVCDTPPDVLQVAQASIIARKKRALSDLLNSDATGHPAVARRKPPISAIPMVQRPPPPIDPQQPVFLHLRKLLRFSPRTNAVRPSRNDQPRDPLDFSATLPLPRPLSGHTTTQPRSDMNSNENSRSPPTAQSSATSPTTFTAHIHRLSTWWPVRVGYAQPHIVDVPLAQAKERNVAAGAPKKDDDIVPDEYFDPPSPDPNSQQPAAAVQTATGEHGGDRFCFCF